MLALSLTMVASAVAQNTVEKEIAPIAATSEYRPLVAEYGRCIAGQDRKAASEFVLRKDNEWTDYGKAKVRKLIDKDCVPDRATQVQTQTLRRMTPDMLRPSIADALVRTEFLAFDSNLISTAQPLPRADLVEILWPADGCKNCSAEVRKEREEVKANAAASMEPYIFGECAVRTDPANTHKLLVSEIGSEAESSVFSALAPAFGQCVSDGLSINSTRTVLRGLIALSYYRLAHAPRVAVAAGATK